MKNLLHRVRARYFDLEIVKKMWDEPHVNGTTEDAVKYLESLHPKQIVMCNIPLQLIRVKYEYTTHRGNRKQGEKVFVVNSPSPEHNGEALLNKWITKYNKENQHRQISNVKFLDSFVKGMLYI